MKLNEALVKQFNDENTGSSVSKALAFSHKLARMGQVNMDTVIRMMDQVSKTAMDTAEAGAGGNWADVDSFSPEVIEAVVRERRVSQLFERRSIPRSPFIWPVQGARPSAFMQSENTGSTGQTALTASTFGTLKTTFDAKYMATVIWTSDELEDDSITTVGPQVQENSLFGLVDGEEDAILNADSDGTHLDHDTQNNGVSNDPKKSFDGLRKRVQSSAKVDLDGGDILDATITATAKMGRYGARKSDLAIITGVSGEAAYLKSGSLRTLDKYGPNATIMTGEVGKVFNIPVIVSDFVREDVDSTGVNASGGDNTFSYVLIVNRRALALGVQKDVFFEPGREPLFNQDYLIARERVDFQSWYGSSDTFVSQIHNLPSVA